MFSPSSVALLVDGSSYSTLVILFSITNKLANYNNFLGQLSFCSNVVTQVDSFFNLVIKFVFWSFS